MLSAVIMATGACMPIGIAHATALRGPGPPTREPPDTAGASEPVGERGEGERAHCALTGEAMFELVSKYRGREWVLAADHDEEGGVGREKAGRFVLTMGASEGEDRAADGQEGESGGGRRAAASPFRRVVGAPSIVIDSLTRRMLVPSLPIRSDFVLRQAPQSGVQRARA